MTKITLNREILTAADLSLSSQRLFGALLWLTLLFFSFHPVITVAAAIPTSLSSEKNDANTEWFYIAPKSKSAYVKFFKKLQLELPHLKLKMLSNTEAQQCDFSNKKTHFITAGIKALESLKDCDIKMPVFAFYLTQQQFYKLSNKNPQHYKNTNAFFVDQPLIRQVALSHYFLPRKNNIGILYSSSVKQQIIALNKVIPDSFNIQSIELKNTTSVLKKLPKISTNSDLMLALVDNNIYNSENAKSILLTTYRIGKPLFGGTRGFVKAGIVASCYSSPEQLINELIETLKQSKNLSGLRQYPTHFKIIQNSAVAHSMNLISVDDKTLKQFIQNKLNEWGVEQ